MSGSPIALTEQLLPCHLCFDVVLVRSIPTSFFCMAWRSGPALAAQGVSSKGGTKSAKVADGSNDAAVSTLIAARPFTYVSWHLAAGNFSCNSLGWLPEDQQAVGDCIKVVAPSTTGVPGEHVLTPEQGCQLYWHQSRAQGCTQAGVGPLQRRRVPAWCHQQVANTNCCRPS